MALFKSSGLRARRGGSEAYLAIRPKIFSGGEQSGLLLRAERPAKTSPGADGTVHRGASEPTESAGFLRRDYAHAGRLPGRSRSLSQGLANRSDFQYIATGTGF